MERHMSRVWYFMNAAGSFVTRIFFARREVCADLTREVSSGWKDVLSIRILPETRVNFGMVVPGNNCLKVGVLSAAK